MRASVCRVRRASIDYVPLRSSEPSHAPAFIPNYLAEPDDVRAMIQGVRQIRKILSSQPIASGVVEEIAPGPQAQTDEQLLEFMEKEGNCAFHLAGTCKMGRDSMAVVDGRLRVVGVDRLLVIDASIMPRVTAGNTNAPSTIIGEKGSDMIRQDAMPCRPVPTNLRCDGAPDLRCTAVAWFGAMPHQFEPDSFGGR